MGKRHNMRSSTGLVEIIGLTETFIFNPKEGIDNPVMVTTEDADSVSTPSPRLCVLKRDERESYGFHLRVERGRQGHIIRNVVSGGVAVCSGLQDGDRLLEVNNCYVDDVPHPEVARKIKLSGHQLCLLVLDGGEYEQAMSRGEDLQSLAKAHKGEGCKPPRLCHITKDPASDLGINFTPVEGEKGRFSVRVVKGGAAEKAGVCKGDHLVWMNGATVSDLTHSALSRMMKKCGNHITILVIDGESETNYERQRMPILPAMAVPHNLPYRARRLHLESEPEGYGFLLRLEKAPSGRTSHVLREMGSGSPAERAGMQDGELLMEVNGESVESLKHEEIVDKVRRSGQQMSLTTITRHGLEFYTQLGLSPLLFCEDGAVEREKGRSISAFAAEQSLQKEMDGSCKPRHCSVQKGPLGFGFNLDCVPQSSGTFVSQVAFGGSGQSAGLLVGDVLMEVNGQNVEEKYLEDVIFLVKEGGNILSLLVMDKTGYNKLKQTDTPMRDITDSEVLSKRLGFQSATEDRLHKWRLKRDMTEEVAAQSPLGLILQRLAAMHEGTSALQQQQSQTLVDLAAYQKADRDLLQGMLRSSAAPEGPSLRVWSPGTAEGSSNARAGVLAVRQARPHPAGLSSHGGGAVGPDCGTARLLPRSGRDVPVCIQGVFTKLCGTRDVRRPWSTSAWFGPGRYWRHRG
ncbi:NHERF family PDZ scaffold protein 4b [Cottoperca gobio]|uniref:NHERF family PDZ scaffold protein 4b n=1 Tax=Cottoperca gobio TaxID=56716 RepID=A0A6J2R2V2_COTGO|nr:Na(+)/H(+) exchange regulatory cofactor NHE-RF3-like [Cottoperca gobio]